MTTTPRPEGLRVLHVAEALGGGVASALKRYTQALPEAEHHLLYARRADAPVDPAVIRSFSSAEEMVSGHSGRVAQLRQIVRRASYDVLHLHSSFAGAYGRLAARKSERLRIIYTPHCFAFERQDIGRLQKFAYLAAEVLLGLNTTTIAACSEREQHLGTRIVGASRSVLLPNAVDDKFVGQGTETDLRDLSVMRVVAGGRLTAQRDPAFFVETRQALADSTVNFTWVGGGDVGQEANLRRNGVDVTGWLNEDAVAKVLKGADIYLHTAAWDGFPMSVLEATGLGVPSVVRKTSAFSGLGVSGIVQDPQEAAAVLRSVRNGVTRTTLLRDWRTALQMYNPNEQKAALKRVYGVAHDSH